MISNDYLSLNRINGTDIKTNDKSGSSVYSDSSNVLASVKTGDMVSAQIVSRDGDNVKLSIGDNNIIDAKISGALNLDAGKSITFEVKSKAGGITLTPLYTNLSSDPNISRALNAAGLPITSDTYVMTKNMMQAGMSIDRNSLLDMFKDVTTYPNSSIENIVDIHKLGIELNDSNLSQIDNYKNLSYTISEGMQDVADSLRELIDINTNEFIAGDNTAFANNSLLSSANIYNTALNLVVNNYDVSILDLSSENIDSKSEEFIDPVQKALALLQKINESEIASNDNKQVTIQDNVNNINTDSFQGDIRASLKEGFDLFINENGGELKLNEQLSQYPSSNASSLEIYNYLSKVITNSLNTGNTKLLSSLMNNSIIKDNLFLDLKNNWSITPSDVAEKDNITALYNRLQKQLGIISETIDNSGLKGSVASNAVQNMNNNLDFLNQLNQMYSYIQLPIKLSSGDDAHGDLYVYSNGRNLSANDGRLTALLHLDMEHLGKIDVFVSMNCVGIEKNVTTNFTVEDDSILDFLNEHMEELTKRLEAKGYSCNAKLGKKNEDNEDASSDAEKSGIFPVLSMTGSVKLSEYSFDART